MRVTMMRASLSILAAATFAFAGCAAADGSGADESNLDTSGCSGLDLMRTSGPVTVQSSRPPTASCWNTPSSGVRVSYAWSQTNDATPDKPAIGFWLSLNGAGKYVKASSVACAAASGGISYGADTSGNRSYTCTASASYTFADNPEMQKAAYDAGGHRTSWDVQVAVALDAAGHWDSLNGANYRFSL